jgi:putative DNA primase/helicase
MKMNPFEKYRSKQASSGTEMSSHTEPANDSVMTSKMAVTRPAGKPGIKKPQAEESVEMQYANHIKASADIKVLGDLMYRWNNHFWKVQDDKEATRLAFTWLSENMGKRATVATAESCVKAAMLFAEPLPEKSNELVIPLVGVWLVVDQYGHIRAEAPNPAIGVTHYVPVAASMAMGDYQPGSLPADSMFARFLATSLPNPEVRRLVQTYVGYSLTGHTNHQVAQFWIGEKGGNGKSTMLKIVMALHEKAVPVQLDKLDGFNLTSLIGATLVACDETPKGKVDQQMLKSLISGGATQINRKYKNAVGYANTAKFIICANHLPGLIDQSDAFWRRFHVIEWNETFTNGKAIPDLDGKIIRNELHYVLDWALSGLQALQRAGKFVVPAAVHDAAYQAKLDSNSVAGWAEYAGVAYCDESQLPMDKGVLFQDYTGYCRANGLTACASPQFYIRVRSLFPHVIETRQTMGSGINKKRVRCVNLTMGVFGPDGLKTQVAEEMDEIIQAFGYDKESE